MGDHEKEGMLQFELAFLNPNHILLSEFNQYMYMAKHQCVFSVPKYKHVVAPHLFL